MVRKPNAVYSAAKRVMIIVNSKLFLDEIEFES
jgi:hypothetical protein